MSTFNGHALVMGISASGNTVGIGGYAQVFTDSLAVAHRAKFDEHVGTSGKTAAFVHTNQYFEVGISFRPASTTSIAEANGEAFFVAKGSTVALSGFRSLTFSGTNVLDGDWIAVGDSTVTLNKEDPMSVDMTIRRYADAAQQTLLKTQVS